MENPPQLVTAPDLEKRQAPRLHFSHVQFRHRSNGKIFAVWDLSPEGMGLRVLDPQDLILFAIAMEVEGTLNIRGEKFAVSAVVKRLSGDQIGCQFVKLSADLKAGLAAALDPRRLGRELHAMPVSDPGLAWFHGACGTDLVLKRDSAQAALRFALYVMGSYVEWDLGREETERLQTGRFELADDLSPRQSLVQFETLLLTPDTRPDPGKLSIAKTLLLGSKLAEDVKQACLTTLG